MIENKEHLTPEGASKIIKIKSGMNAGRPVDYNLSINEKEVRVI